jgi:uncharacterized protein YndB with AHSA1/START domain
MTAPGRAEVRRHLSASVERVFSAFAQPETVARWLRPAPEVKLTVLELDFREGGSYRFAYDTPEGQRMLVGGTYRSIEPPARLVFSWLIDPPDEHAGIESLVTVTITSQGAGTELSILHERFGRADASARHAQGWAGALELLDSLLTEKRPS